MRDIVKIVNDKCFKALSHQLFDAMLDEMDVQYGLVLYHQEGTWPSRGKVLRRFFHLPNEIKSFFRKARFVIFKCPWMRNGSLTWLSFVTELLNVLNLQLKGKDQIIPQFLTMSEPSHKNYCCSEDIFQQVTLTIIIFTIFYVQLLLLIIIFGLNFYPVVQALVFYVHKANEICVKVS